MGEKLEKKNSVCMYMCHVYVCRCIMYIYMNFLGSSRGTRVGIPQGRSLSHGFVNFKTKVY